MTRYEDIQADITNGELDEINRRINELEAEVDRLRGVEGAAKSWLELALVESNLPGAPSYSAAHLSLTLLPAILAGRRPGNVGGGNR